MHLHACIVPAFIHTAIGTLILGWHYQEWENERVNSRFGGCAFMMLDLAILLLLSLHKKSSAMLIVLVAATSLESRSFGSDDDADEVFGVHPDVDLMHTTLAGVTRIP